MYVPSARACAGAVAALAADWTLRGLGTAPSPWGPTPPPWGLSAEEEVCCVDSLLYDEFMDLPWTEGVGVYGGDDAEMKEEEEGVVGEEGLAGLLGDRVPFSLPLGLP